MPALIDAERRRVRTRPISEGDVVWELSRRAPRLFHALRARQSGVASLLESLRREFPVSGSCATFQDRDYIRPHGHFRAFYRHVPGGVIGIKGADVFAHDLESGFAELRRQGAGTGTSLFDSLTYFESKTPLALLLSEAMEEAEAGAAFQSAHLRLYHELARTPVPLLVCRWRPAILSHYRSRLPADVWGGDLAAFAYFYPSLPIRVRHLAQAAHNGGQDSPADRLRRQGLMARAWGDWPPASETVSRWITLAARMMASGFSPCRQGSTTGQCLQEQNAVIDGGFVDVGSLHTMSSFTDDAARDAARLEARDRLSATIDRFLYGYRHDPRRRALTAGWVSRRLAGRLAAARAS